jgi:pimeloyl-ACP methyl ester carboxylesterase
MSTESASITPFTLAIPDGDLEDLRRRLAGTRWPTAETVDDWSQGVPLAYAREICDYWATDYDWRKVEAELNGLGQFTTTIDGLDIHFIHVRSPVEDAQPLIMTHGWPGSVIEFLDVIGPLTDPVAHGGDPADAFHLVCPSLPGYGLSAQPTTTGWDLDRIALAWVELMRRLGYDRFLAQGGDSGAVISSKLGRMPGPVMGIHLSIALGNPDDLLALGEPTAEELAQLAQMKEFTEKESAYAQLQSTRPQTLGYALTDSPAGQCAWILEKFRAWTDCDGYPENAISRDRMLDNISLYWLTGTATSSARLYWESLADAMANPPSPVPAPTGYSLSPKDLFSVSERWLRTFHSDVRYYRALEKGGHFAAMEQPETFVGELRAAFRTMR